MSIMYRILISKPLRIIAIFLIFLTIIWGLSAQVVGAEKYRQEIISKIVAFTGKEVLLNSQLSLKTIPILNIGRIIASDITILDKYKNNSVEFLSKGTIVINVSLIDFYFGKVNLKSLEIIDADINLVNLTEDGNDFRNWDFINNSYNSASIEELKIVNSKINYSKNGKRKSFPEANLKIKFKDKVEAEGNFIFGDNGKIDVNSIISNVSKDFYDFEVILNGDGVAGNFKGKLLSTEDKFDLNSHASIKLTKPSFFKEVIGNVAPFLTSLIQTNFPDEVAIESDIKYDGKIVKLDNVTYDSKNTKGEAKIASYVEEEMADVQIHFISLNVEDFIDIRNKDFAAQFAEPKSLDGKKQGYLNFSLIDNENINLNIDIGKLILPNLTINDVALDFNTKKGQVNLGNISFAIHDEKQQTKFELNNFNFKKIDDIHLLLGDFSNNGNSLNETLRILGMNDLISIEGGNLDYKILSKIILSQKEISFFDIDGKIGESSTFSGNIASTNDEINHFNVDLKFNNLKLNNISMPLFKSRINTLIEKSVDDDYLSYFRWFRTMDSSYRLKFEFKDTELENEKIRNLKVACKLLPGNMIVQADLDSDFADGNYRLELSTLQIKPSLNIQINSMNIDFNKFNNLFLSFLNKKGENSNQIWDDSNFNLFRIHKYNAKFDLSIIDFLYRNQKLGNFRAIGHTSNKILYLDNLYARFMGGELQSQGNISFYDQLIYQFSFNSSELDLNQLIDNSFPKLVSLNGKIAATGSLISQGESVKDLVSNLSFSARVASPILKLKAVDSDEIVDVALKRKAVSKDKVLEVVDNYLNNGEIDITDIQGSFTAKEGIISTNDLLFKTRFTNAILAMSLDLNNLTISSNTAFYFSPYGLKAPISYSILKSGDLRGELKKTIDKSSLVNYIKWQYNIVTQDDIEAAKTQVEVERKLLNQDPDNKDYLFYKLEQQKPDSSGKENNMSEK